MSRIKISQKSEANGKVNQDSLAVIPQGDRAILCIADGVGGLDAGEIASRYITSYVEVWAGDNDTNSMGRMSTLRSLKDLILKLHDDLLGIGDERDARLASTVIVAVVGIGKIIIAAVGDSRVYIRQGETTKQITVDQTVEEHEKQTGEIITRVAPDRKSQVLYEWIGYGKETPNMKFYEMDINEDIDVLLCTDGLSNNLTEEDIYRQLRKRQSGAKALDALTELAVSRGEDDNITSILYRRRAEKKRKR